MISFDNFSYRYRNRSEQALQGISFRLNTGDALAVVGPSQSGKTTLAYALTGLLGGHFPGGESSGSITLDPPDLASERSGVGFVFRDPMLQLSGATETVEEEIAFSLEQFGLPQTLIRERIAEQLDLFSLQRLKGRHPRTLSGGETQSLVVACEAAKHPRLFILDEPARSLDSKSTQRLGDILLSLKRSCTVILIDERLELALKLCNQVLLLDGGIQRFFGSPRDLLNANIVLSSVELPDWIQLQRSLDRKGISVSYQETMQWLKRFPSSK